MASSAVEARMLVSFFSRTTFTSRSVSFAFSPMIMPFVDIDTGPDEEFAALLQVVRARTQW